MVSSLWTASFYFIPLLTHSVSHQIEHLVIMQLNMNLSLKCFSGFFSLVICMASGSAFVHLCLLFSHSHFFVLLLSQVHFNRQFSSSIDLQAWNFFSRHLRKWKYLEHSWTECPVSCKTECEKKQIEEPVSSSEFLLFKDSKL